MSRDVAFVMGAMDHNAGKPRQPPTRIPPQDRAAWLEGYDTQRERDDDLDEGFGDEIDL
jgi:hypothetical protein